MKNSSIFKKIIMVDSDPRLVKLCQMVLGHEGYQVTGAFSSAQCLDSLCRADYDLILLDPMIDNTDGWNLASMIQTSHAWQNIPILLLTSLEHDQVSQQCFARSLAVAGYLPKPFPTAHLMQHIKRVAI